VKRHPGEDDLQAQLDGALDAAASEEVASHLQRCGECRRAAESLGWAKEQAARLGGGMAPPPDLERRIRAALDEEDRRVPPASPGPPARRLAWAAVLAAVLVLGVLGLVRWRGGARADLPSSVAADFRAHVSDALPLALHTADVERMERFFAENGVPFPTRVFDLGMMGQDLVGGRVHAVGGRRSALFVYRGRDGSRILCQMYLGTLAELPPPDAGIEREGIAFRVYERGGITLVFWPEGDVVCVLVGEGPRDAIIQLAFAKAMKVA
jgi:anti-sigma factor RsiW